MGLRERVGFWLIGNAGRKTNQDAVEHVLLETVRDFNRQLADLRREVRELYAQSSIRVESSATTIQQIGQNVDERAVWLADRIDGVSAAFSRTGLAVSGSVSTFEKLNGKYLLELGWQRLTDAAQLNMLLGLESALHPNELETTNAIMGDGSWTVVTSALDAPFFAGSRATVMSASKWITDGTAVQNLCLVHSELAVLASTNEAIVRAASSRCKDRLVLLARIDALEADPSFDATREGERMGKVPTSDATTLELNARRVRVRLHRAGFQDVIGPIGQDGREAAAVSRADDGLGNHHIVREPVPGQPAPSPFAVFEAHRLPLELAL